ncbi:MAG TPA: hypothetical protein VNF04_11625 [Stellaceae bacterium]|nr:hypothetical protein [Stellaceae bacterium]
MIFHRRFSSAAVCVAVLTIAGSAAAAAPLASALGPEAVTAQPAGGFVGTLSVVPAHAPEGTPIAVTASGLPPDESFDLVWRTVTGSWKAADGEYHGRNYQPVGYRVATVRSDAGGKLAARFIAPEDFGFGHDIVLQQGAREFTQAGFSLDMTVKMSPQSGPPGTPVTLDIKGIGWRQLENSWMLVYDNNFTGWISAVSTHGSAHFAIPATGYAGTHVLQLIHGEFTFPYLNPQQNPDPDRPRFKMKFAVTAGDPVLPPAPDRQAQTSIARLPAPGELVASPAFSGIDRPVTVRGKGFTPGKTYQLGWSTVTGNRMLGAGWEERTRTIAAAKADSAGSVAFAFTVPDDLGGAHRLTVEDGDTKQTGTFWIAATAYPLKSETVRQGETVTLHLKGVGWTETANIYHVVYDDNYLGYACGFNSQGDVTVNLPATGAPGWHFIDLYPGIYKGKEVRPNNFRIPQLTYAADHPAEDLPAFHFAVHVIEDSATSAQN